MARRFGVPRAHGATWFLQGATEMIVTVRLYAGLATPTQETLRRAGAPMPLEVGEEATVGALLDALDLPSDEVKVTFVNGRARPRDHRLEPGDEVGIFPPIGGG